MPVEGTAALQLHSQDLELANSLLAEAFEKVAHQQGLTEEQKAALWEACESTKRAICSLTQPDAAAEPMQTDQGQQAPAEQQEQPQEQQPAQQEAAAQGSDLDDVGIADLHQQVQDALARVKQLRADVPGVVAEAMQRELAELRPAAESLGQVASGTSQAAIAPAEGGPLAAEAEQMRALLGDAMDKLPGLRARLDQAVQRLTRIVSVYESEQSRPSPRTVEKVLFNRDRSQEEGDDTQLAADTAEAAATRKRLARELCGGPGLPTTAGVL